MADQPDWEQFSAYFSEIGRRGGKPEQRKAIATKASKAAAEVRSRKARKRRQAKKKGGSS